MTASRRLTVSWVVLAVASLCTTRAVAASDRPITSQDLAQASVGFGDRPYVVVEGSSDEAIAAFQQLTHILGDISFSCTRLEVTLAAPDHRGCRSVDVTVLEVNRPWKHARGIGAKARERKSLERGMELVVPQFIAVYPLLTEDAESLILSSCVEDGAESLDEPMYGIGYITRTPPVTCHPQDDPLYK